MASGLMVFGHILWSFYHMPFPSLPFQFATYTRLFNGCFLFPELSVSCVPIFNKRLLNFTFKQMQSVGS
jgi:hypothetical protein